MTDEEMEGIAHLEWMLDKDILTREDEGPVKIVLKLIETQNEIINLMAGRIVELLEEKNITNHSKKDVIDIFKNLAVNNLLKEVKEDEI